MFNTQMIRNRGGHIDKIDQPDRARADAERRVLNGDVPEAGPGETVVTLRFAQAASATRVTSAK